MAKFPTIGMLRNRIEFQTVTKAENAQFRKVSTWMTQFTLWGNINPTPGLRYDRGDNLAANTTHIITIRHNNTVLRSMRIRSGNEEFKIVKMINVEEGKKRFTILHCEQLDAVT